MCVFQTLSVLLESTFKSTHVLQTSTIEPLRTMHPHSPLANNQLFNVFYSVFLHQTASQFLILFHLAKEIPLFIRLFLQNLFPCLEHAFSTATVLRILPTIWQRILRWLVSIVSFYISLQNWMIGGNALMYLNVRYHI